MWGLETIKHINAERKEEIESGNVDHEHAVPLLIEEDGELPEGSAGIPFIGDYRDPEWAVVPDHEALFVDTSGFGNDSEPALSQSQFLAKLEAGYGYALIEHGQFQGYVQKFYRIDANASESIQNLRRDDRDGGGGEGKVPVHAWPGGYTLTYITKDCAVLCGECANGKNGSEVLNASLENSDPQWFLEGVQTYDEGPTIQCDHCNADIESSYGDPDAPDED